MARKKSNAEKRRAYDSYLLRTYGIDVLDYERLFEDQNGTCGICGRAPISKRRFHVDHDHKTGAVRGLLCYRCNVGMGYFKDDTEVFVKVLEYLYFHSSKKTCSMLH